MDLLALLTEAIEGKQVLKFIYTNYKGETSERHVSPLRLYEGSTQYHRDIQWLLQAMDLDKNENRNFAVRDIAENTIAVL